MNENTTESSKPAMTPNILQRFPKLGPIVGICAAFLILVGSVAARQYIRYQDSSAACYGYGCTPTVRLGARIPSYGYANPLQYGTITISPGQAIEVSWYGQNVDYCAADGRWTSFQGTYYPPTIFSPPITSNRTLSVTCYNKRRAVASSSLNVIVSQQPSIDSVYKWTSFADQEYPSTPTSKLKLAEFVILGSQTNDTTVTTISTTVSSNISIKYFSNFNLIITPNSSDPTAPQILVPGQISTTNGNVVISFPANFSLPQYQSRNLVITANFAGDAVGNFSLIATYVGVKGATVFGLPATGQNITFVAFNCIKAPCTSTYSGSTLKSGTRK